MCFRKNNKHTTGTILKFLLILLIVISCSGKEIDTALNDSSNQVVLETGEASNSGDIQSELQTANTFQAKSNRPPDPEPESGKTVIIRFITSGWLKDKDSNSRYHPAMAFDGKKKTSWVEGEGLSGEGSFFGIELEESVTIDEIAVLPGYGTAAYFSKNNRVQKAELEFDGYKITREFKDKMEMQRIRLEKPVTFTRFRFTVNSVYDHKAKWDDTCVAEIVFYENGSPVPLWYNHVAVEYDEVDSLMTMETKQEYPMGDPASRRFIHVYNDNNKIIKLVEMYRRPFKTEYNQIFYTDYTYNKDMLLEKEKHIDSETGDLCWEIRYYYSNNILKKKENVRSNARYISTYDEYGNMTLRVNFKILPDNTEKKYSERKLVYEYNNAGLVSEMKDYVQGELYYINTYEYDRKSRVIKAIEKNVGLNEEKTIEYEYGSDNRILKETTNQTNMLGTEIKIYEYNESGFLKSITTKFINDGRNDARITEKEDYTISSDGYILEIKDKDGKVQETRQYKNIIK
jgi:hypothetical protein